MSLLLVHLQLLLLSFPLVYSHMNMAFPPPRGYKNNPKWNGPIDYTIVAPLSTERPFPCQGKPKGESVLTIKPGSTINVRLEGGAVHGGGHCQMALGYGDNPTSWVVLETIYNNCMIGSLSYEVKLPSSTPGGDAVFAWTWINALGNREYYMNCADITISGPRSTLKGPSLLVANLPGYPTIPEFHPPAETVGNDLLRARPIIEISGEGSDKPVSTSNTPNWKKYDAPQPQNAGVSASKVSNAGSNCEIGEMKCFGDSKWGQCSTAPEGTQWFMNTCASGLKCVPYIGKTIQCQ